MTKPGNSDDKCCVALVHVKVQGGPISSDEETHLYTVTHKRSSLSPYSSIDPGCSFIMGSFFLKDDYPEWCQARGEKIDQNNGIPERESQCTLFPSVLLTNWVTSSPHPLFTADQPFLASMDLIIIPMSILNMWHKFHHRGLSIERPQENRGHKRKAKAQNFFLMHGNDGMIWTCV